MPRPYRVLIVDDVPLVRESLEMAFAEAGHHVKTVESGARALEMLDGAPFDVLVTDIWMPDIDGLALIDRLRSRHPDLRIFAMTGGGPQMTIETAATLAEVWGAERVFVKPFDERALLAAVSRDR